MTPDLLLQSSEVTREEEQVMQTIYSVLREGYSIYLTVSFNINLGQLSTSF